MLQAITLRTMKQDITIQNRLQTIYLSDTAFLKQKQTWRRLIACRPVAHGFLGHVLTRPPRPEEKRTKNLCPPTLLEKFPIYKGKAMGTRVNVLSRVGRSLDRGSLHLGDQMGKIVGSTCSVR